MSDQPILGGTIRRPSSPAPAGQTGGQGAAAGVDQAKEKATEAVDVAKEKATEVVDATKEKAGAIADQAATKVDAGIDKAAGGLDKAADLLRDKSEQMGDQGSGMQSMATQAADKLEVAAGYLKDKDSDQLVADLEALVRRKPVESLLVALGVGFLLSKAVR